MKEIMLSLQLLGALLAPVSGVVEETSNLMETHYRHEISSFSPEEVEGAIIHEPVDLESVYPYEVEDYDSQGTDIGYEPDTLTIGEYNFDFSDHSGNSGMGEDFDVIVQALDNLELVKVGNRGMETFFGHNNNLSNTGPFAILGTNPDILTDGMEVIVTDDQGLSKGYWMTQTIEFSHADQIYQFYGDKYIPDMVYNGFYEDMIYIQHCRWDVSWELLVINIGQRIW